MSVFQTFNCNALTMHRVATRLTRSLKPLQRPKSAQSMTGTWSWTHVIAACVTIRLQSSCLLPFCLPDVAYVRVV
jgi:hypothetical protein